MTRVRSSRVEFRHLSAIRHSQARNTRIPRASSWKISSPREASGTHDAGRRSGGSVTATQGSDDSGNGGGGWPQLSALAAFSACIGRRWWAQGFVQPPVTTMPAAQTRNLMQVEVVRL